MTLLHCEDLGETQAPSVLFIPGMVGSSTSWTGPFRALARHRRLLLVDLLGSGYSPKPEDAEYSLNDHLQALRDTLSARGVSQVDVVGHSMGALLALAYAARFTQEVRRAALLGMPWYRSETEARHTIARSSLFNRALALETPLAHFACTLMCLAAARAAAAHALVHAQRAADGGALRPAAPLVVLLAYAQASDHRIAARRLAERHAPAGAVRARHARPAPLSDLKQGTAHHAGAVLEELDAGHDLIFTHAKPVARRLDGFLSR